MDGQCVERRNTPRRKGAARRGNVSTAAAAGTLASFSVILRSNAATTGSLTACSREYVLLLQRELHGLAELHVLTDLSLWAPQLPRRALRAYADAHEKVLEQQLPGVISFAFTVADVVSVWPRGRDDAAALASYS